MWAKSLVSSNAKHMIFDVRRGAVCPPCNTRWRAITGSRSWWLQFHSVSALLLFIVAVFGSEVHAAKGLNQADLTGMWRLVLLDSAWNVEFTPASQKDLDRQLVHCGKGIREPKAKGDKEVTQEICLWINPKDGRLRASMGGVSCKAPFSANALMRGECRLSADGPAVPFSATRTH